MVTQTSAEQGALQAIAGETLVTVIVPAYNEAGAIIEAVERVRAAFDASSCGPAEILVLDDGSTDETAERARAAGATVISHPANLGQGAAIKTGVGRARGRYVALIDGDGSYPAEDLPRLVQLASDAGYEQVIGDRQGEAGSLRPLRAIVKRMLRAFAAFGGAMSPPMRFASSA